MPTKNIRLKLCDYIRIADIRKVKALYTLLVTAIETEYDYSQGKEFKTEIGRRSREYKNGKGKVKVGK